MCSVLKLTSKFCKVSIFCLEHEDWSLEYIDVSNTYVILHAGINDAPYKTGLDILNEIVELMNFIKVILMSFYTSAQMMHHIKLVWIFRMK